MSIAVCNSSPLIAFATIDQLRLLELLFSSVLVPSAVAQEIARSIPILPSWMDIQQVTLPLPEIVLRPSLGSGEREAIALALGLRAGTIVLDDLPARRVAHHAGLNVIGTVGILLAAKRRGFIKNVRAELDKLLQNSFFLSPELYALVVDAAGEKTQR